MKNHRGYHGKKKCGHSRCNQGNRGLLCIGSVKLVQQDPFYSIMDNAIDFNEKIYQTEEINNYDTEMDTLMGNDSMSPSITYERRVELAYNSNDIKVLENIYTQSTESDIKAIIIENKYVTAHLLGLIFNDKQESPFIRKLAQKKHQAKVLTNIFGF